VTVTYRILVGEPEGKRTLEMPTLKLKDSIKMVIHAIEWDCGLV
jgi:hypothetical protein